MHRYLKLSFAVLIGLAIFTTIRLVIFTAYFDLFKENSAWSIFLAILHGIRFDASIFLTIISPFIVLLLLPVNSDKYQKIIYWIMFPVYAAVTIYLIIDAVYFGYVSRHLAGEFATLGNDYEYIYTMAKTYFYMVVIVLIVITLCGFFWKKFADIKVKEVNTSKKGLIKSALYFILIGGIVFIFIRGSFDIKPISTINAFVSGNNSLANLTLNGLFTSLRYMTENKAVSKDIYSFYDDNQTHDFILSLKHKECIHPFSELQKPNIVFVLLESWSSYYVDAFSGSNMQLTPNLNRLASEGIMFINHYSPERRSISAIQAVLLGIPPMDNIPKLGFGLETIAGSGNLASNLSKN
ncbi:MAG: LTA synthase family protein, partial [Bacilli bacterium]